MSSATRLIAISTSPTGRNKGLSGFLRRLGNWLCWPRRYGESMQINSNFSDLLRAFGDGGVRYLVVGGYAVMRYTEPRYTDLDLWVDPEPENAARVFAALRTFGAPLPDLTAASFTDASMIFQIGVAPVRVDIIMGISGLAFSEAWKNRQESELGEISASVLSLDDLIASRKGRAVARDRTPLVSQRRLVSGLRRTCGRYPTVESSGPACAFQKPTAAGCVRRLLSHSSLHGPKDLRIVIAQQQSFEFWTVSAYRSAIASCDPHGHATLRVEYWITDINLADKPRCAGRFV